VEACGYALCCARSSCRGQQRIVGVERAGIQQRPRLPHETNRYPNPNSCSQTARPVSNIQTCSMLVLNTVKVKAHAQPSEHRAVAARYRRHREITSARNTRSRQERHGAPSSRSYEYRRTNRETRSSFSNASGRHPQVQYVNRGNIPARQRPENIGGATHRRPAPCLSKTATPEEFTRSRTQARGNTAARKVN